MGDSDWVLIVDDDPKLRFTLSVILKRAGYSIACAENGENALRQIRTCKFCLICLDIRLPDISGLELLVYINQLTPGVPVVVLTADDSVDTTLHALRKGACGYLLKPLNPSQILACIDRLLPKKPLPKYRPSPLPVNKRLESLEEI
jgi:DNA-binding NtrC family response regulator